MSASTVNKLSIELVWDRILQYQGKFFYQKRGKEFSYTVTGNVLVPNTVKQNISKGQFEKAISYLPFEDTGTIQHLRAPSYIFAILMDSRIRKQDW